MVCQLQRHERPVPSSWASPQSTPPGMSRRSGSVEFTPPGGMFPRSSSHLLPRTPPGGLVGTPGSGRGSGNAPSPYSPVTVVSTPEGVQPYLVSRSPLTRVNSSFCDDNCIIASQPAVHGNGRQSEYVITNSKTSSSCKKTAHTGEISSNTVKSNLHRSLSAAAHPKHWLRFAVQIGVNIPV